MKSLDFELIKDIMVGLDRYRLYNPWEWWSRPFNYGFSYDVKPLLFMNMMKN